MPLTDALHYVGQHDSPAAHISLRAIDPDRFVIVNGSAGGEVLEEIEESKAFWEVYDGAVYMFQVRTLGRADCVRYVNYVAAEIVFAEYNCKIISQYCNSIRVTRLT